MSIFDLNAAVGREVPFEDLDEKVRTKLLQCVVQLDGVVPPLDIPGVDSKGSFEVRFEGSPLAPVKTIRGSAIQAVAAVLKIQQ